MKITDVVKEDITRRGFLQGAGAAAVGAGAGIAGYKHFNPPPRSPQEIITDAIKSGKWSLKAYREARNEGYSDEEIADYLTDYKGQVYTKFKQEEPPAPTTVINTPKESVSQGVAEGWKTNALTGAMVLGGIGAIAGSPIIGTVLGLALGNFLVKFGGYHNDYDENDNPHRYKVLINQRPVPSKKQLSKEEAISLIVKIAEKEFDRKTEYSIYDTEDNKIVFRQYWSDNTEDSGWKQIQHDGQQGVAPIKQLSAPVAEPTKTVAPPKASDPADFSKRGFTGYKKPGDMEEGIRVPAQQILGTKNRAKSAYYPTNVKPKVPKLDKPLTDQELARLAQLAGIKSK